MVVRAGDHLHREVGTRPGVDPRDRGRHRHHWIVGAEQDQCRHLDLVERRQRIVLDLLAPARCRPVTHGLPHVEQIEPRLGLDRVDKRLRRRTVAGSTHIVVDRLARRAHLVDLGFRVTVDAHGVFGPEHHLHVGCHHRCGDRDDEANVGTARGREQRQPTALAEPPDANPFRVYPGIGLEHLHRRDGIVSEHRIIAVLQVSARFPAAAPVIGEHCDTKRRKHFLQVLVEQSVAQRLRGGMRHHHGAQCPPTLRQIERSAQRSIAAAEAPALAHDDR